MGFNELNSVEYFILHQLTGINLNDEYWKDKPAPYGGTWQYILPEELKRTVNEVLLENELKSALIRLNPEIEAQPELAEEVIYKLRASFNCSESSGLSQSQ
jgi:type I restriction enzyme, R subunit